MYKVVLYVGFTHLLCPVLFFFLQTPLWKIVLPRNFDTTVEYCWWNMKLENGVGAVEVPWHSSSLSHQPLLQHTCKPLGLKWKTRKIRHFQLELELAGNWQTHDPNMAVRRGPEQLGNPQNFDQEAPSMPSFTVLTPAADHQELNSLCYTEWIITDGSLQPLPQWWIPVGQDGRTEACYLSHRVSLTVLNTEITPSPYAFSLLLRKEFYDYKDFSVNRFCAGPVQYLPLCWHLSGVGDSRMACSKFSQPC